MKRAFSMRLFAAVAIVALPSLALADSMTFSVPNIVLTESNSVQTGYFDIIISNSADSNTSGGAGDNPYQSDPSVYNGPGSTNTNGTDAVYDYQAEVTTSGALTFIGESDQTQANGAVNAANYIYASNSFQDPSFSNNGANVGANSNQDFYSFDFGSNAVPSTNVVAGTSLGLLQVEYSIPANTTGVFALTLIDGISNPGQGAIWGDVNSANNIPLFSNGSITVNAATPEPSSLLLLVLGAVGLFGARRLRSR